jgi:hypothetical protein
MSRPDEVHPIGFLAAFGLFTSIGYPEMVIAVVEV